VAVARSSRYPTAPRHQRRCGPDVSSASAALLVCIALCPLRFCPLRFSESLSLMPPSSASPHDGSSDDSSAGGHPDSDQPLPPDFDDPVDEQPESIEEKIEHCQQIIEHRFEDVDLLHSALTHASGAMHRLGNNE